MVKKTLAIVSLLAVFLSGCTLINPEGSQVTVVSSPFNSSEIMDVSSSTMVEVTSQQASSDITSNVLSFEDVLGFSKSQITSMSYNFGKYMNAEFKIDDDQDLIDYALNCLNLSYSQIDYDILLTSDYSLCMTFYRNFNSYRNHYPSFMLIDDMVYARKEDQSTNLFYCSTTPTVLTADPFKI